MIGQTIVFDGHNFNDLFYVGEVNVGLPEFVTDATERVGGNGSMFRSIRVGTLSISVQMVAKPLRGRDVRESLSTLLSWLDVDGERPLYLSNDRGLRRMVVPNGAPSIGDAEWNDRVTVEFLQLDPMLYGKERTVTVPSGGSVTFNVGGDASTQPSIAAQSAVRNGTSRTWGIRLDDGDYLRVAIPTSSATPVEIDCKERTCRVGGAVTIPTIDSDWFVLAPGTHTVRNDVGSGACALTWTERWHR